MSSGERVRLVPGGTQDANGGYGGAKDAGVAGEDESSYGDYIKAMLFGALDGVLTSFAIVAGAAGGGVAADVILILGFSNILADALSMGVGEYLSSKAHNDYVEQERKRQEWLVRNNRESGVEDMVGMYVERGMSAADARAVVGALSKYDRFLVDALVSEELGLPNFKPLDECDSLKEGLLMFLSFAFFGSLPLVPYIVVPAAAPDAAADRLFLLSCLATAVCLFAAGACKSAFSARGWLFSGLETLLLGGACAGLAFEVGAVVSSLVS